MSGPAVWSVVPSPTDFLAAWSLPSCVTRTSCSIGLGQSVPALDFDPILLELGETAEAEGRQVGEAARAVEHEVADGVAGRGGEAEADAGQGGEGDVAEALDDGAAVRRVLDKAGPATQDPGVGGAGEELGQAQGDAAHEGRTAAGRDLVAGD